MFSVTDLSPDLPFGKIVCGLTHDDLRDEAVRQQLRDLWEECGFIVFDGSDISEAFHVDLSRVFGVLEVHRSKEWLDAGNPELITISSANDPVELEVDGERGDQFQNWHKDSIYIDRINRGGVLRALKPSTRGGLTGFVDMADLYDRLPADLQRRIEPLRVVYSMDLYDDQRYSARRLVRVVKQSSTLQSLLERRARDFPPVSHPLVLTLTSGRKALNFSPVHPQYVEGLTPDDSHALLSQLSDAVFDSPAYHHRWTTDQLLLWDNWRMTHMVSLSPSDEHRVMQRTTIAGDYDLGRVVAA